MSRNWLKSSDVQSAILTSILFTSHHIVAGVTTHVSILFLAASFIYVALCFVLYYVYSSGQYNSEGMTFGRKFEKQI